MKKSPLNHPSVIGTLNFDCDEKILPLVNELNKWNVQTLYSCQGENGRAYVCFTMPLNNLAALVGCVYTFPGCSVTVNVGAKYAIEIVAEDDKQRFQIIKDMARLMQDNRLMIEKWG